MEDYSEFWDDLTSGLESLKSPMNDRDNGDILIGSGTRFSPILFVGDDPTLYENEDLKVLPDSSGEFLIKLCDIEEIIPEDYYITTLSRHNCKYRDFLEKDQDTLKELLEMQIALMKPKIVVALGAEVARVLFGKDIDFSKTKGTFINWIGGIKVFITYDIDFVKKSRNDSGKKSKVALEFWNDLKTLKKELNVVNSKSI